MKDLILVDTDVIVQYLKSGKGVLPNVYEKYEMCISAATFAELLSSKTFEDSNLQKEVVEFVDKYFTIKEVTREIADEAARIIRLKEVSLATALIAATAVRNSVKLLSEDKKEYQGIDGLELMDA
jgi:predicted nucleic acid-binding protein